MRLADTELFIEIEKDYQTYGEENKFGGGKTVRDGMGQSASALDKESLDMCILGATIIDHWGIVKADIGIKDGKIFAIGKAGNPDAQDGVTPGMVIGPATEVHGGWGYIVTPRRRRHTYSLYLSGNCRHCVVQRRYHPDWWRYRS